jgi:hypothetical protein
MGTQPVPLRIGENLQLLENQDIPKRMRPTAFREALREARSLFLSHGKNVGALHVLYEDDDDDAEGDPDNPDAALEGPACSSCTLPLDKVGVRYKL